MALKRTRGFIGQRTKKRRFLRLRVDTTHLLQRFAVVLLRQEVDVPGGDNADQLAAHFARLRDGDAGEAVSDLGFEDVAHRVARTHHHGVRDETLLKSLGGKKKKYDKHQILHVRICAESDGFSKAKRIIALM